MSETRILVISNNCFSLSDSNGRTLAKYFSPCFEKNEIAQFFIHGTPDKTVCTKYYQVSDGDALHSFIKRKEYGHEVSFSDGEGEITANEPIKKASGKTPFKLLLREMAWKHGKWYGSELKKWILTFKPTHLFLFLADNSFLVDFSKKLSDELNIPIIVYSTEDYYFKKYNYVSKTFSLWYKVLHKKITRAYHRCEKNIKLGIFNTPMLTRLYGAEFSFPCECMFAKSDIDFLPHSELPDDGKFIISYLGNLELNRHKALMEIADAANEIVPGTRLCVYGKIPDNVKTEFLADSNIDYKGFVSYEDVVSVIHKSNLLVHTEYDDVYNCKDLKFAFSTKIADSICSGTPLFMYGNRQLAETDFLIENNCAFVSDNKSNLKNVLKSAILDLEARMQIVKNAEKTRQEFFCTNSSKSIHSMITESDR